MILIILINMNLFMIQFYNQPLTCTSKIYSSGVLLRTTLSTFYYYQGDVIPN